MLVPELLETTRRLRELLNSRRFPFELRHVDLRCGSDPTRQHLTLVITKDRMPRLPIETIAESCPYVVGIGVNLNPKGGAQVIKGPVEAVLGVREIFVEVAGLELRVSPGSFFNQPRRPSSRRIPLEPLHPSARLKLSSPLRLRYTHPAGKQIPIGLM